MEEKGDLLLDILKRMSIEQIKILIKKAGKDIELNAKKEVFDDKSFFEKINQEIPDEDRFYGYKVKAIMGKLFYEYRQRHLSTFAKQKQHN